MANAIRKNLLSIVCGTTPSLQMMMQNGMLDDFYVEGLGFRAAARGATSDVLPPIRGHFESYTYIDISPGFFESAHQIFSNYSDKMVFKIFAIEKDVSIQGYKRGSYDLVIASDILHATQRLQDTYGDAAVFYV
ncbi:uncharacterized protein F4812DRAFT_461105 [Daldinia caldariorum]|uniref:uncharacterized protein n=1 Tax=Daldinia caldariorum TaxID=326644 RepID=UPI0020080422|nr:uncharacterized protein F4812DRAFT_461105 [Daldinia caldariorum]KAI1466131.1 hypothetical protein F4812DRAFT_461105 [Daldinia caldariorum]